MKDILSSIICAILMGIYEVFSVYMVSFIIDIIQAQGERPLYKLRAIVILELMLIVGFMITVLSMSWFIM